METRAGAVVTRMTSSGRGGGGPFNTGQAECSLVFGIWSSVGALQPVYIFTVGRLHPMSASCPSDVIT